MENVHYWIGALAVLLVGGAGIWLLVRKKINQKTFCFILMLATFGGIWIGYSSRLKEVTISLTQLKMVQADVRDAQRDVQDREEKVKQMAALVGDLITFIRATTLNTEGIKGTEEWLNIKLATLNELSGRKIDNPFSRFAQKLSTRKEGDEEQLKQIWADYAKDLESELQKMKSR